MVKGAMVLRGVQGGAMDFGDMKKSSIQAMRPELKS